ncbi:hypothetical protein NFF84_00465 [Proteus mirabilis]|uniref:hypothetical protein n=1 Tax=Proteus mirabilis TaxID=584 RepID=UPI00177AEF5B|nr:hypothetical protein [Proteus mirabilis]MDF7135356.1 hypothetical protein [Proteus mirabilis]MDF7246665.1 hypothetical protein [Proteus mirabilis]MDF7400175.1 hypothetical protein [Proteus mirabilis]MDF7405806.1 hypothetical protein [Proteus mirabilis]MDF7432262.1 hypothetical protein [Proteus mirabilis]
MPIYEQQPDDILSADINAVQQPEPTYGDNVSPSWYDPINPLDDRRQTKELRDAAFRIDNSVGSLIATVPFNQFEDVDGYNPFEDELTLSGYEDYADAFIHSNSPQETAAIKQRIDRERNDKQMLADAGGAGVVSSIAMGVIDPINVAAMMIPGGAIVKGGSVATTAGKFALANIAGGVASEMALHSTQETRTLTESAINITLDAMIGGTLGSAAQLVKNRGELVTKVRNDLIGEQQSGQQNIPNNIPDNSSVGAMEVPNTTLEQETLKGPSFINRTMNVSPAGRAAQSPAKTVRQINQQLAENNFTFAKNEEGIATFTAVETKVRGYEALIYKQVESTKDAYKYYRKNAKANGENTLSLYEFSEQVGDAMRNGDRHVIPEVAEAATAIRPIVEKTKNRMIELGILREGVSVSTSESYFPRIYKFDKILSDRTEFKKIIADWLEEINQTAVNKAKGSLDRAEIGIDKARNASPQAERLGLEIKEAESWSGKKSLLMDDISKYQKIINEKNAVEVELNSLSNLAKLNKTQTRRQATLQRKLQRINDAENKLPALQRSLDILDNPRKFRNEHRRLTRTANSLTRYDRIRQSALNRMTPLDREEIDAAADDIINKIIGAPSGIVPSELIPDGLVKRAGFTKNRTLNIPDERIKDYLESDVNYVMENYIRQVAPEIELTAKFGRVDMEDQIKAITEEYNQLIADATTPKERSRLEARREADLRDIRAMRDRVLGTYGAPKDPSSFFVRAGRVARHVNFLRLLGGMTISSLPDMARPIMQHGLRSALKPLGKMLTDIGAMRIAKSDLREMGIGLEYALSSRSKVIADLSDPYSRRSYLERGLQWSSQKFGNFTLMNQYTDFMKMWSGVVTQSKVLRAANTLDAGGSLSKREIKKLAHIGIDESMLKRIADQFKRHGEDLDGMLTGHSHLWDDRVVRETFQAAVLKDVRTTVITPGIGDTPLMMSSELGKIVMQFKTFFFATHNRALVSGIQSGDASFYYGALLQVALGSLVYVLKAKMAGRDINTEPANLVKEGLDWSGMMGWLGEPNNVLENLSGGTYGMSAMFGGPPASRYQSRNGIGALLGPTFDLGGDIKNITSGVLNGEFDDREVRSVRKLLPFQNLFYLSPLLNQVEEQMK